jgi:hypothetical protein
MCKDTWRQWQSVRRTYPVKYVKNNVLDTEAKFVKDTWNVYEFGLWTVESALNMRNEQHLGVPLTWKHWDRKE